MARGNLFGSGGSGRGKPMTRVLLREAMERIKRDIERNMSRYGRNATMRSVRSLHIAFHGEGEATLEASKSFNWMERGVRGGGSIGVLKPIIYHWMRAKGIALRKQPKKGDPEKARFRVAGAIAYTIIKHGTRLHRNQSFDDIYSSSIERESNRLGERLLFSFDEEITRIFRDMK